MAKTQAGPSATNATQAEAKSQPKQSKPAAWVVRRPGTASSVFRRTFTDKKGGTEKLVFEPGKPIGVTAEQAEFLRDDIAKGVLAPCTEPQPNEPPVVDEDLVAEIREDYAADQGDAVTGQLESLTKETR